ncbi:MAG TPA: hypothetical protein VFF12_18145, partial [Myxococcaceae bacterium]|nr:hypothetical protein [Myxococcaceae bacterium]
MTGPGQVTSGLRVSLQAAVQGTSTNKDVVWSVEGGGTLADVHANPATYTAPIQSGVTTVHVKATAAADGTRIGTLDIEVDPVPLLVPAVNTAVTPTQPTIPDGHGGTLPVADSRDEHGIRSEFVVGQILVRPRSQSALTSFLQRYGGTVVGDNSVPEPPPNLGVVLTDAQRQATEY